MPHSPQPPAPTGSPQPPPPPPWARSYVKLSRAVQCVQGVEKIVARPNGDVVGGIRAPETDVHPLQPSVLNGGHRQVLIVPIPPPIPAMGAAGTCERPTSFPLPPSLPPSLLRPSLPLRHTHSSHAAGSTPHAAGSTPHAARTTRDPPVSPHVVHVAPRGEGSPRLPKKVGGGHMVLAAVHGCSVGKATTILARYGVGPPAQADVQVAVNTNWVRQRRLPPLRSPPPPLRRSPTYLAVSANAPSTMSCNGPGLQAQL
jgi:hypothetical protein